MLSRAFTKPRKSPNPREEENSLGSGSIQEYEDFIIGFTEDLPLVNCDNNSDGDGGGAIQMTLREVIRASVGVVGESRLGVTEKVVLWGAKVFTVKRFRKVIVRRREFGKRVQRFAEVSRQSEHLVPISAYLYTKRIKLVVYDYYPMGSLSDLLSGARELGHTALDWNQRLMTIFHVARAISFIHSLPPEDNKQLLIKINVHGNIKSSNVMIRTDFTACLTDYGFVQLADRPSDAINNSSSSPEGVYSDEVSCETDVYNFGIIMLDLLGGPKATRSLNCVAENRDAIRKGECDFFEFCVEGTRERDQAVQVLDLALACALSSPDTRPSIEQLIMQLVDIIV